MKIKEEYQLNVQNLMDLIPTSIVAKQTDVLKDGRRIISRSIRWVVGNYAVYSKSHWVHFINSDNTEQCEFHLKTPDYQAFVDACEARRAELFGPKQKNK